MNFYSNRIEAQGKSMRLIVLLVLYVVLCVSTGLGQEQTHREISVGAGISIPMGPDNFTYHWNTGFNVGAAVTTSLSPIVSLGIAVDYSKFGLDNTKVFVSPLGANEVFLEGGSANIVSVSPVFKAMFSRNREKVTGFVLVGLGYHHESTGDLNLYDIRSGQFAILYGTSHSAISVSLGLGMDIPISERAGIILQSQFFNAYTENQATQYALFRAAMRFSL
jgi:hypothetical protein